MSRRAPIFTGSRIGVIGRAGGAVRTVSHGGELLGQGLLRPVQPDARRIGADPERDGGLRDRELVEHHQREHLALTRGEPSPARPPAPGRSRAGRRRRARHPGRGTSSARRPAPPASGGGWPPGTRRCGTTRAVPRRASPRRACARRSRTRRRRDPRRRRAERGAPDRRSPRGGAGGERRRTRRAHGPAVRLPVWRPAPTPNVFPRTVRRATAPAAPVEWTVAPAVPCGGADVLNIGGPRGHRPGRTATHGARARDPVRRTGSDHRAGHPHGVPQAHGEPARPDRPGQHARRAGPQDAATSRSIVPERTRTATSSARRSTAPTTSAESPHSPRSRSSTSACATSATTACWASSRVARATSSPASSSRVPTRG